jgi:hypothetical protein
MGIDGYFRPASLRTGSIFSGKPPFYRLIRQEQQFSGSGPGFQIPVGLRRIG